MDDEEFRVELTALINRHGVDNDTCTPDYILADLLISQVRVWSASLLNTMDWHGWETLRERHQRQLMLNTITEPTAGPLKEPR